MAEIFKSSGDGNTYSVPAPNLSAEFVPAIDKRTLDRPFGYVIGWGDGTTAEIFNTAVNSPSFSNLLGNRLINAVTRALAEAKSKIPATPQFDFTNLIGSQGARGPRGPRGPKGPPGVGLTSWEPTNWISSTPTLPNPSQQPRHESDRSNDEIIWGDTALWVRLGYIDVGSGLVAKLSLRQKVTNTTGNVHTITMWCQYRHSTEEYPGPGPDPAGTIIPGSEVSAVLGPGVTETLTNTCIVSIPFTLSGFYYIDLFAKTDGYGEISTGQFSISGQLSVERV